MPGRGSKTEQKWIGPFGKALHLLPQTHCCRAKRCMVAYGKKIASSSADKTVHIWNATSKNPALIYRNHSKAVTAVGWSPDGSRLASGSRDTTVQVWNVQTGRKHMTFRGFSQEVSAIAWSPDGKYIAAGSWDTTIQVREPESGSRSFTYQ